MSTSVADLFASLGVKVEGEDMAKLAEFTQGVKAAAEGIREIVKATKELGQIRFPTVNLGSTAAPGGGGKGGAYGPFSAQFYAIQKEEQRKQREQAREVARAERETLAEERSRLRQEAKAAKGDAYGPSSAQFYLIKREKEIAGAEARAKEDREKAAKEAASRRNVQGGLRIAKAVLGVATVAGALALVVRGLKDMAVAAQESARSVDRFNSETGYSVEEIAKWRRLGTVAGVGEAPVLASLQAIQKAQWNQVYGMGKWAGYGMPSPIGLMGRKPEEVLMDFMDKMKGRPEAEMYMWGEKLGINKETIYALQKFGSQLNAIEKSAFASSRDVDKIRAMTTEWGKFSAALGELNVKALADVSDFLKTLGTLATQAATFLSASQAAREGIMHAPVSTPVFGAGPLMWKMAQGALGGGGSTVNQTNNISIDGGVSNWFSQDSLARKIGKQVGIETNKANRRAANPENNR